LALFTRLYCGYLWLAAVTTVNSSPLSINFYQLFWKILDVGEFHEFLECVLKPKKVPYRYVGRSKVWGNLDVELPVTKQWVVQLIAHDKRWVAQSVGEDVAQGISARNIATNKLTNLHYVPVVNHFNTRSLTTTQCLLRKWVVQY
jgi:hypothetical protein